MKKWTRLSAVVAAAAMALTLGLTAASASGNPTGAPTPPDSGHHAATVAPQQRQLQNASPRPPRTESVYVPIKPCRIINTTGHGGRLGNGATRSFYVSGTFGFAPQGGKAGGCGIPLTATAIAATIQSANSASNGYLTAYPHDQGRPLASNLNYTRGQTIASGGNISIQKNNAVAIKIFNSGGPTNVLVDVTGYYAQQMEGMISPTGAIYSGSDRIVAAQVQSTGYYRVQFDSDVTYCTPMVDVYAGEGVYGSAYAFNGPYVYVSLWTLNNSTHLAQPLSAYFYVSVTC